MPTDRKVKQHPLDLAMTWDWFKRALRFAGTDEAQDAPAESGRCGPINPDTDPEFFFPDTSDRKAVVRARAVAKGFCGRCDVLSQCLAGALDRDERYGVYGGLDEHERRQLATAWQQAKEEKVQAAEAAWQAKIGSGV